MSTKKMQPGLNIGVVGHVDHGKTSLTSKLTGTWTDKHSDEIKQGISIKLGYADCSLYKCPKCKGIQAYGIKEVCNLCGSKCKLIKKISFVDAPGHETLMAVMLSGATILHGAILVIAANEDCPQPRTLEHFKALKMHGIKNIVVAQNKIDLVSKEEAQKNYKKIRKFLDKEGYTHVPIIPTSAHFDANVDALTYALAKYIPKPEFNLKAPLKMRVIRSFDINRPGTSISKIKGGVLGGSILQGTLKKDQEVWLYPGIDKPMKIQINSLNSGKFSFDKVHAGGLVAVGTNLDNYYTNSDKMSGQLVCDSKAKPKLSKSIVLDYNKIERLIESNKKDLKVNENIVVIIGSSPNLGLITSIKGNKIHLNLKKEAMYYLNERVAVSRLINGRWRLSGYADIKK